jgi:hypothetical protein
MLPAGQYTRALARSFGLRLRGAGGYSGAWPVPAPLDSALIVCRVVPNRVRYMKESALESCEVPVETRVDSGAMEP